MRIAKEALFATPIHRFVHPDAATDNPIWREALYQLRERDPGRTVSNVQGWQSSVPLQTVPALGGLARFTLRCLHETARDERWDLDRFEVVMEGWANINGRGAMNNFHNHPNCLLSGVYYLDTPQGSGNIVFRDPREAAQVYLPPYAAQAQRPPVAAVTPEPGLLLVFPSWLLHAVERNAADADRVSVAFNAIVQPRRTPEPAAIP